jgi:hypothetical protein
MVRKVATRSPVYGFTDSKGMGASPGATGERQEGLSMGTLEVTPEEESEPGGSTLPGSGVSPEGRGCRVD